MKKINNLIIISILTILFTSGCGPQFYLIKRSPETDLKLELAKLERKNLKEYHSFNLATDTDKTGTIILYCLPQPNQIVIKKYEIQIDDFEKVETYKYSDVVLTVAAGIHKIKIKPRGFGKLTEKEIVVPENGTIFISFQGPFWRWGKGALKIEKTKNEYR